MPKQVLFFNYAAAIPVGHEIEVFYHPRPMERMFGDPKPEPRPYQPICIDRTAGIEYGMDWHFTGDSGASQSAEVVVEHGPEPQHPFAPTGRVQGRVTRCQVSTVAAGSIFRVQTRLEVETIA